MEIAFEYGLPMHNEMFLMVEASSHLAVKQELRENGTNKVNEAK